MVAGRLDTIQLVLRSVCLFPLIRHSGDGQRIIEYHTLDRGSFSVS